MIINIGDDILLLQSLKLLKKLLVDKTTKKNIMWATDAYKGKSGDYERNKEMTEALITGRNADVIKTRARKAMEQQSERTKQHAEVFTPLWIVQKMNDHADEVWFGCPNVFFQDGTPTERVSFPKEKTWQSYVDSRRLEITCGEAPYLVTRYDVETGEVIPIKQRVGILDRKLRVVTENALSESEWLKWAYRAMEATYGYEFQGDNVLIARVNLLMTFEEHLRARWNRKPTASEYFQAANIIAWNIWQMDGLAGTIPYCRAEDEYTQLSMFDEPDLEEQIQKAKNEQPHCQIFNWRKRESLEYLTLQEGRNMGMKFDYIIGNPPYQDDIVTKGDRPNPIYNRFMDESYKISDVVELIHPARFLSEAGQTPKEWNRKMLHDEHFKVLYYEPDGKKIFPETDIKGGVAITIRNAHEFYGEIGTFTSFDTLNSIIRKIGKKNEKQLKTIIASQGLFRFSEAFFKENSEAISLIGKGTGAKIVSSILEKLPSVFLDTPTQTEEYVRFLGRINNQRIYKYIKRKYLTENSFIDFYKLFIPEANNKGTYGETLTESMIGLPLDGSSDTFLNAGPFKSEIEAKNLAIYIKTKFFRALLGVKKVTQHCPPVVWELIPLQDFTEHSDIDWTKSVAEIDKQLYAKYGLDETEINFIETHVKEMQ